MTDKKPNRRGVLTAVATLTGAAALGATMPVSAVGPDPIFALLEACKRARAEAREATDIHKRIAEQIGDAAFPPHVEVTMGGKTYEVRYEKGLEQLLWENNPSRLDSARIEFARFLNKEVRGLTSQQDMARYEAERIAALEKFAQVKAAYAAEREASGYDVAELRMNELDSAFWDTEKAVLLGKPTSSAGAIALLIFSAEYLTENSVHEGEAVCALVSAARAVAGVDASKIAISDRLANALERQEEGASA